MKQITISISLIILISLNVCGQNDHVANKILDKFSANALGAPSVSMKFNLVTTDQVENTNNTLSGIIILSKDKYKLDLPENIVWFNGEINWSYLVAEKEVTITKADKKDNSFQNRPSEIFSMYKKGFKCRIIEEQSDLYVIDLYPENLNSDLIRVRLTIGKTLLNLKSLEYKKKDGIVITLNVIEYNLKMKPDPGIFIFKKENYKGVEIIDMR
jgi:outer membrane lipoprotein-sorting protein